MNKIGNHSYKIGDAIVEDAVKIAEIQRTCWISSYTNELAGITEKDIKAKPLLSEKRLNNWKNTIKNTDGKYKIWVARNEKDEVVAFCKAEKSAPNNILSVIYILPGNQGKGLGTDMIKNCLAWLGNEKNIQLDVVEYNNRAIKLYERFGFKIIGRTPTEECSNLPSGKKLPEIRMIKSV